MKITTKEQAFQVLDNNQYGLPFEAIEFLYNHPTDEEILHKIQTTFDSAYNYYLKEEEKDYQNPVLWYAILAEKHLDLAFLDAIIKLITQVSAGSDFLDEQLCVLIGLLGREHGAIAVEKVLAAIEETLEDTSKKSIPLVYLFDVLFYADLAKNTEAILRILEHPKNEYFTPLGITLCYAKFDIFIPKLKELIKLKNKRSDEDLFEMDYMIPQLEALIKDLEAGKLKQNKDMLPYFHNRGPWDEYYPELEDLFEKFEDISSEREENLKAFLSNEVAAEKSNSPSYKKVGRNEPCPCGSGKKYKKCCLKKK